MSRRLLITLGVVLALCVATVPAALAAPSAQAQEGFLVRLLHGVPDASAVDVLIDGALAASQLAYGQSTDYLQVGAGEHLLNIQAGGATLTEATISANAGQALTVVVTGSAAAPEVQSYEDDLSPLVLGNVRLAASHAVPGVDAVDVVLPDGSPVLQGLAYGQNSGSIDIPANTYPLAVTPAGSPVDSALRPVTDYSLGAGMFYRLVVLGGTPDAVLLAAPVLASGDSVYVSVAHAIPDAPAVDVYIDSVLAIPNLAALSITPYIALPLGSYELGVRPAGSDTSVAPIASTSVDFSDAALAGQARTLAAITDGSSLGLTVFEDDFSPLDPGSARLSVLNTVAGASLLAELDSGVTVPTGAAFESAPAVDAPAGMYELLISGDGGASSAINMPFNGGTLYRFLVTGSAAQFDVRLASSALSAQPGSIVALAAAPAAQPETTEEPAATEAPAVTGAPAATEVPPEAPAEQPTAAPVVPTQAPVQTEEGYLGQVYNLNPGANLQLRQYPNASALSLGLVQAGTVVIVQGRAGEPDFQNLADLPPNEDLDPLQTWLSVVYSTPEGGTITAWVIAQYIQVTDRGERVRLADLDPLPSDVPGEVNGATTAAATDAPSNADFYGVVFNMNPGVNLNIRRTPDTLAEVLAAVPNGTVLEPVGILEDYSWAYVNYLPEGGGVVSGWVSTQFMQFVFRGNTFLPTAERIDELLLRSLLRIVDGTERGTVSDDVTIQSTAAAELSQFRNQIIAITVLDPGANLHLRRTPDAASQSLALIPDGATLVVEGRSADSAWLQVEYDNTTGWVASGYVELRLNNRRVTIDDVPAIQ